MEIRAASSGGKVDFLRADFELMSDVARVAAEIAALTDRVDALINNAGGMRNEVRLTPEGNEITFASNHLAPFLLTRRLMPLLRKTAAARPSNSVRVIAVSSSGHETCPGIDWDDLQLTEDHVAPGQTYCLAKLANILFTRELAKRVAADGIVAQVMHPGVIDSNFISHTDASTQAYIATLAARSPDEAADTLIWLATSAEAGEGSGRYFHQRQEVPTAPVAQDDAAAKRLWEESENLLAKLGY